MGRFGRWWAVLVAMGLVWSAGGAAWADSDGSWWYDKEQVAAAQADGWTGAGVPVAVIDGSIDPSLPMLADAHLTVREPSMCTDSTSGQPFPATGSDLTLATWHGSNVVGLIVGNGKGVDGGASVRGIAPGADLRFYAVGDPADDHRDFTSVCTLDPLFAAIVQAVDDGARIVSMSVGPKLADLNARDAVAYALHKGVVMVVGLGEQEGDSDWLAGLNGVVAVQAVDSDGDPMKSAFSTHAKVTVTAPGVDILMQGDLDTHDWSVTSTDLGTSYATPLVAGMLAVVAQKYPKATNNQLVQSLIANTGSQDHALGQDATYGYGTASLAHLLRVDPTQYPDVNPLITEQSQEEYGLSAQDIATAQRPVGAAPLPTPSVSSPAPVVSPSSSGVTVSHGGGMPVWVWWVVVVVIVVVVVVVAAVRRGGKGSDPAGPTSQGM